MYYILSALSYFWTRASHHDIRRLLAIYFYCYSSIDLLILIHNFTELHINLSTVIGQVLKSSAQEWPNVFQSGLLSELQIMLSSDS